MSSARPAVPASAVDSDRRPVELSRRQGRRETSARAFAQGVSLLVRVIQLVVSIIVAIILAGILLVVLKANPSNSIVSEVHSWAHWLAGPFDGMFSFHSADTAIAVNWGIAAVLYLFVGVVVVRPLGGANRYPRRSSSIRNQERL
jgi:hypothetical protein